MLLWCYYIGIIGYNHAWSNWIALKFEVEEKGSREPSPRHKTDEGNLGSINHAKKDVERMKHRNLPRQRINLEDFPDYVNQFGKKSENCRKKPQVENAFGNIPLMISGIFPKQAIVHGTILLGPNISQIWMIVDVTSLKPRQKIKNITWR